MFKATEENRKCDDFAMYLVHLSSFSEDGTSQLNSYLLYKLFMFPYNMT